MRMRKWMRTTLKAWKKKAMSEMLDLETVERNLNAVSPILLRLDRRQYENRCASAPPLKNSRRLKAGARCWRDQELRESNLEQT
jgi:hypothetical protein